jgi:hypothetical protein
MVSPDWIVAGSSVVTALGVAFIAWQASTSARQLKVLKQQVAADHERSRRQRAIDVLERWTNSLDRAQPSARVVVEGFSIEECKKLKAKEAMHVPEKKLHFVRNALQDILGDDEELLIEDGKGVKLNENHVAQLYFLVICHLNSLEVALQNWLNGVADTTVLENELEYLIKPDDGHFVLENFRTVMGGKKAYPAIAAFVKQIRSRHEAQAPEQRPNIA